MYTRNIGQDLISVILKIQRFVLQLRGDAVQECKHYLNTTEYLYWWLVDRASYLSWFPTWCTKILIYLYIIHLLKSSTCFEHYPAHLQEVYVVTVYMQPLVSSPSAGLVHRLWKSSFLTGAQDSHLQTVTIPEAAYIQLRPRPPEDEQGNARNM